jgi:hypothetical protein
MSASEPAFPIQTNSTTISVGLTKREYFAGLALQGLLVNISEDEPTLIIAKRAALYADALIAELEKSK